MSSADRPRFIRLTAPARGDAFWINVNSISAFGPRNDAEGSLVTFTDGESGNFVESVEHIVALIEGIDELSREVIR